MPNIGAGSLILSTDSSALESGLSKSASATKSWMDGLNSKVKSGFGSMGGYAVAGFAGIAAAMSIGAVANSFSGLKEIAEQAKTAKSLGIAADEFQGLTLQMGKCGIEAGQVAGLMGKLAEHTTEAARGNQKFTDIFEVLGMSAGNLVSLPLDQQFK